MTTREDNHDVLDELSHIHLPERRIWKFRIKDSHAKVIFISLILLLFIFTAELAYQVSRRNALLREAQNPVVQTEAPSRPFENVSSATQKIHTDKLDSLSQALEVLNSKPKLVKDARALITTSGNLSKIARFSQGDFAWSLTLTKDGDEATFYLTQEEVDNLAVFFTRQDRRSGVINDLLEGEEVTINMNINFLDSLDNLDYVIEVDR